MSKDPLKHQVIAQASNQAYTAKIYAHFTSFKTPAFGTTNAILFHHLFENMIRCDSLRYIGARLELSLIRLFRHYSNLILGRHHYITIHWRLDLIWHLPTNPHVHLDRIYADRIRQCQARCALAADRWPTSWQTESPTRKRKVRRNISLGCSLHCTTEHSNLHIYFIAESSRETGRLNMRRSWSKVLRPRLSKDCQDLVM